MPGRSEGERGSSGRTISALAAAGFAVALVFVLVLVLDRLDSPPAEGYDRAATQACLRVSGHRVSRIPVGGGAFTFDGLSVGRGEGVNLYFAASESQAAEAAQLDSQTLARRRNVVFYPDTNVGMIDPRILACLPE